MATKLELAIDAARNYDIERVIKLLEEALSEPELNLNCKSVQKRLATSWGYVKAEQAECKECGAKQAQIDRLMLEYCPDEMTPEQMQEWGNNQRPVEQAEQEPVACEPVSPIDDDGWSDWICPKPQGYLMQCCDCGLIHEVDSRVAKYEPRPSEEFVVVNDQNMQSQWRMRRRDDLTSPQQAERMVFQAREIGESEWFDVGLDETERINAYINSPHIDYRRLYAAHVRTKDLTDDEIDALVDSACDSQMPMDMFARAVIAADREKNK